MDPALWELLRHQTAVEDRQIEAIVRLRRADQPVPGVRLVARFGRIATCRLAAGSVPTVRRDPNVVSLKAPRQLGPDLEESSPTNPEPPAGDEQPADVRRPDETALTGVGVVVGVVDWGLDLDHPNLKNGDASTRLIALWDQRDVATGDPPQPYGYGAVHSRRAINRALRTEQPYTSLGYHPGAADRGGGSHGTHVTDIAAGNGRAGGPQGLAPLADLVFVHLADRGTGGLGNLGDSVRLLEAVDFIARAAGDRPWVVNISVGRHGGPHDGTTLSELAFDELLTSGTGRFVVQSTGNYYGSNTHASGRLVAGRGQAIQFTTDPADTSTNEIEIWYDGMDEILVEVQAPGAREGLRVRLGEQADIVMNGEAVGRVYHRVGDPNNTDNHVDAFLDPKAKPGLWTVRLEPVHVVDGRWHAWLERDEACQQCQVRFTVTDADPSHTTGTIANGRLPLVVGAYDAYLPDRPVGAFSSSGPTRDARPKPDLLAPGVRVLAARSAAVGTDRSRGELVRKSGTSMATPHVTGAVALCLEAGGRALSASQIRDIVLQTTQPATTAGTEHRVGRGYLDIAALESELLRRFPRRSARHSKEPSMDTERDPVVRLALAPSRAYRELMYRPSDGLASWIKERFIIVGHPGGLVTGPAHHGDVLLQVTLGRPGSGRCHLVTRPAAVPSRLPPGNLLLRSQQGATPRSQSSHAVDAEAPEKAPPAHVSKARTVWRKLFGGTPGLAGVSIDDLKLAPSKLIADSDFTAWTNSPSEIYVAANPGAAELFWEVVLYHEAQHIKQFRDAAGRPPDRYATMMRYECDAYTETERWLRKRRTADPDNLATQLREKAALFRDEIIAAHRAGLTPRAREERFRRFLLRHDMLPPHTRLQDLYVGTVQAGESDDSTALVPDRSLVALEEPGQAAFEGSWSAFTPPSWPDDVGVEAAESTDLLHEQVVPTSSPTVSRSLPPLATAELPDVLRAKPIVSLTATVPTDRILWMVESARRARGPEPGWAARLLVDVRDLPKGAPATTVHVTVVETVPFEVNETDKLTAFHRFAIKAHPAAEPRFDALTLMTYNFNRALDEQLGWPPASIAIAAGLSTSMTVDQSANYKLVVYAILPQSIGMVVEPRRDFRSLRNFAFDRATLTPDHETRLVQLAQEIVRSWYSRGRVARVVVQGHTDPVGTRDYNLRLARRRAEAVSGRLRQLVSRFSGSLPAGTVDRVPFVIESYGEARPISKRLHSLNRRVEVALYRDRSAPPTPLDVDVTVTRLEELLKTSTGVPADTVRRLRCLLGKVREPGSDDRFANETQVFLIKRDNAMPGPTEWSRVRNLVLDPGLFGSRTTDAKALVNLRRIDQEIFEGVMKMNQIIAYASGPDHGLGLMALPKAFKEFNVWVLDRLGEPKSIYSCYPELRP